ncbi:hypothetical protein [Thermococcus sp.]|uniref:hypothetical protein n=1 Tax=Thermococcus sp. TaxID=35749 RepID=UPI0026358EE2|nr:hypothetical protein [Thermococcus sp.]
MEIEFEKSFELFTLIDDTFRNVLIGVLGIIMAVFALEPSPVKLTLEMLGEMSSSLSLFAVLSSVVPVLLMSSRLYGVFYSLLLGRRSFNRIVSSIMNFEDLLKLVLILSVILLGSSFVVGYSDYPRDYLLFFLLVFELYLFLMFLYLMYELFVEVSHTHLVLPRELPEEIEHVVNLSQSFRRIRRISNGVFLISALLILVIFLIDVLYSSPALGNVNSSWLYSALILGAAGVLGSSISFLVKSYELGIERFGQYPLEEYDIVIFLTGFEYGDIPRSFAIVDSIERVVSGYKPRAVPKNAYFRSLSTDRVAAMIASLGLTGNVPYPDSNIYNFKGHSSRCVSIIESYDSLGGIMNLVPPILLPEKSSSASITTKTGSSYGALGTFPYALKLGIEVRGGNVNVKDVFKKVFGSGMVGYSPAILASILDEIRKKLGKEKLLVDVTFDVNDDSVMQEFSCRESPFRTVKEFLMDLQESGLKEALFYTVCHPDFCEKSESNPDVVLHIRGYNEVLPKGSVEYPLPLLVPLISIRAFEKVLDVYFKVKDSSKNRKRRNFKIAVVALGSIQSNPIIHYAIAHNRWSGKARGLYDLSNPFDALDFSSGGHKQGLTLKSVGPLQFSTNGYDTATGRIVLGFACGRETENNCFLVGMVPFSFMYFPYSPLHRLVMKIKDVLRKRGLPVEDVTLDFWTLSGAGHPGAISTIIGALVLPKLLSTVEGGSMSTELLDDDPTFYIVSFPIERTLELLESKSDLSCPNLGAINVCYSMFKGLVESMERNEIKSLKVVGMRID